MLKSYKVQAQLIFLVLVTLLSIKFPVSTSAGSLCNCPSNAHGAYGFEAFVIRVLEWSNGIPVSWADSTVNPPQCTEPINSLGSTTYTSCPRADMTVEHIDSCSTTDYHLSFLVDWAEWRPIIHDYSCDFDNVTIQLKNIPAGYRCIAADVGNIGAVPMSSDCLVSVPNGWGSHWVTFWIERSTSTVQGLKYKMPGKITTSEPVRSQIITMDGTITTGSQPFYFYNVPPGNHSFQASLPAINYSVGYTACPDNTTCHDSTPITMSSTAALTTGAGGFTDLHWYYWQYGGWFRIRDGSLNYQGNIMNYIPPTVVPYDPYDTNEVVFMNSATTNPNSSGIVTAATIDVGPNGKVSGRDWSANSYTSNKGYLSSISSFVEYARAKKDVVIITDINNVESDRINIIEGDVTINSNAFMSGKKNIVLMATGNVTIANIPGNIFNTPAARVSIAIITPRNIIFGPNITDAGGIFIANQIDLAGGVTSSTVPLKIAGNIISNAPITDLKRRRDDDEFRQASMYVVFLPRFYLDLLPYLSTIEVSGRQLDQ